MISPHQFQLLSRVVLADNNVNLAVVFGPAGLNAERDAISLVLDCEDSREASIRVLTARVCRQVSTKIRAFRLDDARPAAMLMRQVLEQGTVIKDYYGQWDAIRDETDLIFAQAEEHEQYAEELQRAVIGVVEPDDNVTLVAQFAPIGRPLADGNTHPDMNLLLGCKDESEARLLNLLDRLLATGFRFEVMPLQRALAFPYALSHIVRTGESLKDVEGRWKTLQSERDRIIKAGIRQHATVRLAARLYGGPGGAASQN